MENNEGPEEESPERESQPNTYMPQDQPNFEKSQHPLSIDIDSRNQGQSNPPHFNHPVPQHPFQNQNEPRQMTQRLPLNSYLPVVEEPICVLKIELDGEHIEQIKVFENDDPQEIVQKFGDNFNLSQNARQRLLEQIEEQIQMDEDYD